MINPILQKDDTFIRISKYGHVFGKVKAIGSKTIQSVDLKCRYLKPTIISTNNIEYDMNECFKVDKQYTEDELESIKGFLERLSKIDKFASLEEVKEYHKTKKKLDNL